MIQYVVEFYLLSKRVVTVSSSDKTPAQSDVFFLLLSLMEGECQW